MLAKQVGVVVGLLLNQVPFIQNNDGRFFRLLNKSSDFLILCGDPTGGIDDENIDIHAAYSFLRAHDAENFHRGVVSGSVADAGRIAEDVMLALILGRDINRVASGACDLADRRAVIVEDLIDERGFSDIRTADQSELERRHLVRFKLGLEFREERLNDIHKLTDASTVGGADSDEIFKTQARKFKSARLMRLGVHFVDNKNDLPRDRADHGGELAVEGSDSINRVGDKKNHISDPHGDEGALAGAFCKVRIWLGADAACVCDLKRSLPEFADRADPVAGDAGLVVDNGDLASRKTVEEGRFSDVRTAYDGNVSHFLGMWFRVVASLNAALDQIIRPAEKSQNTGQIDRSEIMRQLKHHPSNGHHLRCGGRLARPGRFHIKPLIQKVEDATSCQNHNIPCDHQHGKPEWEGLMPVAETQSHNGRKQKPLVRDRIEHRAESTTLVPVPGDVAIQPIRCRRQDKNKNRRYALPLERRSAIHTPPVGNAKKDKNRDHENPRNCQLVCQGHHSI